MTAINIADRLGGSAILSREIRSEMDLADAIKEGLPYPALEHVLGSGDLQLSEAYGLVASRRTLMRRRQERSRLSRGESDRLARVVRVIARAEETLGDREKAHRWLRKPNQVLADRPPLDLLDSDFGARMVERILGRIACGIYS